MAENVHDSEDEEDDCVIFKGSPLYTSLLQSGSLAEELGAEFTGNVKTPESFCKETIKLQNIEDKSRAVDVGPRYVSGRWKTRWKAIFRQLNMSWFLPDISAIDREHHEAIIKVLSVSSSLEEDDRDFLQFYIQSSGNTRVSSGSSTFSSVARLAFCTIPCLLSIYAFHVINRDVTRQQLPWSTIFLAAFSPATVLECFLGARNYKRQRKCAREMLLYKDFVQKMEKIASMIKKCLRLIQERELISRGFTLVSQRNPLSRLEDGKNDMVVRQCPVLRKLVFTVAREAVLFFREETKKLFDFHPLTEELDIKGTYLAYEPVQSYGPCLQTDTEDIDKLHTFTDGFSISALKGITHLLSLHQSEFIKALILIQQERLNKGMVSSSEEELNIIECVSATLEKWTVSLQKSHDYVSCAWMHKEPVSRPVKTQSNVEDIYVAVHSLDLHLQAALARVKCLSEHIQNAMGTGQTDINLDDLLDQMQPIRAEIESCKGCWEEGLNRIEKATGKHSRENPLKDSEPGVEDTQVVDKLPQTIEDYIIEDQVFEGYTDPDEVVGDYEWDKPLTAEEKEKKRKEKEEALRLLSELKSVISVRAVETERREKAAFLKMYPGLRLSEKSRDNEVTNQNAFERICAEIPNNKEILDTKHDQDAVSSADGTGFDKLTNKYIGSCDANKEILDGENIKSLGEELKQNAATEMGNLLTVCHKSIESCHNRNKHSVITSQGIRRIRKSDMLDLSDSDLEEYPEDETRSEQYDGEDADEMPKLGLPLRELLKDEYNSEEGDVSPSADGVTKFRLPALSLQERLEHFSGANLGLTSELAEKAVAKSKIMGVMEETTFGGDVYGECSSSNDDDDGGDDDDDDDVRN